MIATLNRSADLAFRASELAMQMGHALQLLGEALRGEQDHGVGSTDAIPSSAPAEASLVVDAASLSTTPAAVVSISAPAALSGEISQKFHGVSKVSKRTWVAEIMINHVTCYLGSFADPVSAALAYDKEARKLGRPLNFPDFPAAGASSAPEAPQPLRHAPEATTPVSAGSVANSGQKRPAAPKPEFPNPAPVPIKSALPRHGSQTLSPTVRPIDPTTALMVARPRAAIPSARDAEQDQIAAFLAEKGATKCPTAFVAPSQAAVPADEVDRGAALTAARRVLAESERRKSIFIQPGTPVIYRAGKSRVAGIASDEFTADPDRVAVCVTDPGGTVRTVWPLKSHARPARIQPEKEAAE